jgi:hypothetical protein
LWTEDNFDVQSNLYIRQAHEARKYAFVSDYARIWALYHQGGLYLDTDVEVLRDLSMYLGHHGLLSYESEFRIQTGVIGFEAGSPFVCDLLKLYEDKSFLKPDGSADLTTNVSLITDHLAGKGVELRNRDHDWNGIHFYPRQVFSPKSLVSGEIRLAPETACIHHFSGTWGEERTDFQKFRRSVNRRLHRLLGEKYFGHYSRAYLRAKRTFLRMALTIRGVSR